MGVQYIKGLQDINGSLHAIQELGVVIKDVEIGLCDFPFLLDDRLVFLCWKSGEEQVRWWHDIDSGYANRQPIDRHEFHKPAPHSPIRFKPIFQITRSSDVKEPYDCLLI